MKRGARDMYTIPEIKYKIEPIAREYGVKKVFLFGSYAKNSANEESDIDLMIEKGLPLSLLKLSGMRQRFQETLALPVDLITTAGIEPEFYKQIEGTEVLLYEE